MQALHDEVKTAESYYRHIEWLQERFPEAKYEDVVGLCKLATKADLKEQDYSLNPGRYVGVVIEEDGKSEEEFLSDLIDATSKLKELCNQAHDLEQILFHNFNLILSGE